MSEEIAEETVRVVINGAEVALKIAGASACSLAGIIARQAKRKHDREGYPLINRMLYNHEKVSVLTMTPSQFEQFDEACQGSKEYIPFVKNDQENGKVIQVLIADKQIPRLWQILDGIGYGKASREAVQKKTTVLSQDFKDSKPRTETDISPKEQNRENRVLSQQGHKREMESGRRSVIDRLENYKNAPDEQALSHKEKTREAEIEK